jgi:hypothetical protein
MKVLLRISDGGNNKVKPNYVYDKKLMLIHNLNIFKNHEIFVFADNVNDHTFNILKELHPNIIRTSLGNAGSFMKLINFAIENFHDNENIYLAEDDYIYKTGAAEIIEEGLKIANYVSGYDHPDKYINHNEGGPNPFIEKGGELTRVLITENTHWKITNSCCLTFATTVRQLKKDYDIFLRHGTGDFGMFCDIYKSDPNVRLISAIPSVSTHGETMWLAKFVNWELEFLESINNHHR